MNSLTTQLTRLHPLTIDQVGELAGFRPRSIRNYRNRGNKRLPAQRLVAISQALRSLASEAEAMAVQESS